MRDSIPALIIYPTNQIASRLRTILINFILKLNFTYKPDITCHWPPARGISAAYPTLGMSRGLQVHFYSFVIRVEPVTGQLEPEYRRTEVAEVLVFSLDVFFDLILF